ncbi:hypothetical protein ABZP36_031614 [Zizania latifolia]
MQARLGEERSERYFACLSRFLSTTTMEKTEFDRVVVQTIGRENIALHNHLLLSICHNACVLRNIGGSFFCLHEQEEMPSLKEVALDIFPFCLEEALIHESFQAHKGKMPPRLAAVPAYLWIFVARKDVGSDAHALHCPYGSRPSIDVVYIVHQHAAAAASMPPWPDDDLMILIGWAWKAQGSGHELSVWYQRRAAPLR